LPWDGPLPALLLPFPVLLLLLLLALPVELLLPTFPLVPDWALPLPVMPADPADPAALSERVKLLSITKIAIDIFIMLCCV
jgi:hypothetical protein